MRGHWVIRLPTWLGDTVMAVPTVRALARSGIGRLTLWGPEANARLLLAAGVQADAVLPYSRRRGPMGAIDVARGTAELVEANANGVLLLPNAFEPALIATMARVRRRVGYATEGRGRLLTDSLPAPDPLEPVHDGERYARLLQLLDVSPPSPQDVLLRAPAPNASHVRELIAMRRPLLGIVPGSANGPAKRWPAEAYAELADMAAEEWGAQPLILGGRADAEVAKAVTDAASCDCIDLAGRTDLLDLAALLRGCRAVVANDTGAAHLSAALSCPTLVVFGPTDPRRTRARGPRVRVVSLGAFCQPCMSPVCALDHRCLADLTPELAMSVLGQLWHRPPRSWRVDAGAGAQLS
jgi:heptosyltransferase-2